MDWKAALVFIVLVMVGVILAGYASSALSSVLPSPASAA